MNETDSMSALGPEATFRKLLWNTVPLWILGAILFWFTELVIVLAALPISSDWQFVRDGNSIPKAVQLLVRPEIVGIALLSYALAALFAAVLYVVGVYLSGRRRNAECLTYTGFFAFSYFGFGVFWMNFPFLPRHSLYVSILLNLTMLIGGIFLVKFFHKSLVSHPRKLQFWLASILTLDIFLLGALNIAREALNFHVLSLRALVTSVVLLIACLITFTASRWILQSGRIGSWLSGSLPNFIRCAAILLPAVCGIYLAAQSPWVKSVARTGGAANASKPNILFIVMDTVRADHLSCYGYKRPTSPNTDRIAREGVLFRNVVSPSSWTLPSHASMFTGLFPSEHGADHLSAYLPPQIPTEALLLKEHGYKTLGCSNNPYVGKLTGLTSGFEEFEEGWRRQKGRFFSDVIYKMIKLHSDRQDPAYSTKDEGAARTTTFVSDWIRQNRANPFFIFINYLEPHAPYKPPVPYKTAFLDPGIGNSEVTEATNYTGDAKNWIFQSPVPPAVLATSASIYDGEIVYVDSKIGALYKVLSDLNLLDNTLIIITSDHGENLGEHDLYGHSYGVFNTLLEVPLVMRFPKYFPAGSIVTQNVQTTDLFHTILQAAGIPQKSAPNSLSRSLIERFKSQIYQDVCIAKRDRPTNLLRWARWTGRDASHIEMDWRTLIADGFKYIRTSKGGEELYNLNSDPLESINLASTERERSANLRRRLDSHVKTGAPMAPGRRKIDRESEERLKSLGYVR